MSLEGLHLLITRPFHQSQTLLSAVTERGGKATLFPVIEIKPVDQPEIWINQLTALKTQADFFIFVSANAVAAVSSQLKDSKVPILAVGPGTEAALKSHGLSVQNKPDSIYSTQGLLMLSELQAISGKCLVIFSGEQGKPLLAETLKERHAEVFTLAVYRRVCPIVDIAPFLEKWQKEKINMVMSTSQESLRNWSTLIGRTGQQIFKNIPLMVIHAAMKEMALKLQLGSPVLVAQDATDHAILERLEAWIEERKIDERR